MERAFEKFCQQIDFKINDYLIDSKINNVVIDRKNISKIDDSNDNQPLTLKEISKKYNVTMKNIYLIECNITDKLSKSVPWKMLFAFFKDKYKKMNRKIHKTIFLKRAY